MPLYQFKKPSTANLIFYFLLIILVVFILFNFTKLKETLVLFREIKPIWFALAVVLQIFTYVFVANIFYYLFILSRKEPAISRKELFRVSFVSLFVTQVIPLGGFSGQGYLIHYFQKRKIPAHISFSTVILESFTYYLAHLVFSLFTFVYLIVIFKSVVSGILLLVALFGIVLFVFADYMILMLTRKKAMISLSGKIEKHKWLNWLFNKVKLQFPEKEILTKEWEGVWRINRSLLQPLFWQLMIIVADAGTVFLLFNGFNVKINFLVALMGMTLTKIISMVSVSPGALVFFEGAMILFYTAFGIPLHFVIVVTLLFRGLSFWLPMPFGLYFYKHLGRVNNNFNANA